MLELLIDASIDVTLNDSILQLLNKCEEIVLKVQHEIESVKNAAKHYFFKEKLLVAILFKNICIERLVCNSAIDLVIISGVN